MNILICSWANIFEPDIIYAFQKSGFQVEIFSSDEINPIKNPLYIKKLSTKLLSNHYDFVFSANYLPFVSMACNIHKIRYISWVADSPCFELNSHTITNPINHIFMFDRELYNRYKNVSPNTIYFLPLGCNVERIDQITVSEQETLKYQSDVSFVGSLYTNRSRFSSILLSDYWNGYFNGIIESQLKIYGYNFLEEVITQEAIDAFTSSGIFDDYLSQNTRDNLYHFNINLKSTIIDNFIGMECSKRERHLIVNKLSEEFHFYLYSNEDTSSMPLVHNMGTVEPFEEAFKIYKSTKVNLNITSKTIKTGLPLRIFDILGAGGFLITNYQSELSVFFEIGTDLVVYENINDLVDKISYYLLHEEERYEIAQNGYAKVKTKYQFISQIYKMMQIIVDKHE